MTVTSSKTSYASLPLADAIDALLREERELIATAGLSRADIIAQGSELLPYPFDEFVDF